MKMLLYYTLSMCILFSSCKRKEHNKDKYLFNKNIDVCNYTGNAFIFLQPLYLSDGIRYRYEERIYIVPIPEITDSNEFKKVDAYGTIGNRNHISLDYSGTKYFNDLVLNPNKEYLSNFVCSLPKFDSMPFARVYLSYSNFKDVTNWVKSKPYSDSCDYRYIVVDSKTEFPIFHIYQK